MNTTGGGKLQSTKAIAKALGVSPRTLRSWALEYTDLPRRMQGPRWHYEFNLAEVRAWMRKPAHKKMRNHFR